MPAGQLGAIQQPLINAATIVQEAAQTIMPGSYYGAGLDIPGHMVDVNVTDPGQEARLIGAARRLAPGMNAGLIRVVRTAYSARALTAAADRVMTASGQGRLPFPVYGAAQLDSGASLTLQVPDVAAARRLSQRPLGSLHSRSVAELAGVRLTFEHVASMTPLTRQNDRPPFIGGDGEYGYSASEAEPGFGYCTAGIAVEDSSGEDYLITAGHCFEDGTAVYTMNDSQFIGDVTKYTANADAELIDTTYAGGAGSNADVGYNNTAAGGINWKPLDGTDQQVFTGEHFCQDGINSFRDNYGVPCNLVAKGGVTVCIYPGSGGGCVNVQEEETDSDQSANQTVAVAGDSGGVVFTADGSADYAAGMVSTGGNCKTQGTYLVCPVMNFVPATNLYAALGVHLNPHT